MKKKPKSLSGGAPFDDLMKKVAQVPKEEADRKAREWKKSRAKRKANPKKKPKP